MSVFDDCIMKMSVETFLDVRNTLDLSNSSDRNLLPSLSIRQRSTHISEKFVKIRFIMSACSRIEVLFQTIGFIALHDHPGE